VFSKPADSLSGATADIVVPCSAAQELDYEAELRFVVGKDCEDVMTEDALGCKMTEDALGCILGYAIGNERSARDYVPHEVSGYRLGYRKSFDGFAPLGPCIVSASLMGDIPKLQLQTRVNGELRQNCNTCDMIWSIPKILAHLTRGRSLRRGTIAITRTPSSVGLGMKPPVYIKTGDAVEVTIEGLDQSGIILYSESRKPRSHHSRSCFLLLCLSILCAVSN